MKVIVDLAHLMIMCSHPMFLLQEVIVGDFFSIMAHQHLLEIHIPMLYQEERILLLVRILYFNQGFVLPLDRFRDFSLLGNRVDGKAINVVIFFYFYSNMAQ